MPNKISRRSFLKAGLFGALALAVAGGIYRTKQASSLPGKFVLEGIAGSALAAIASTILADALPPDRTSIAVGRVQDAIAGLPLATQKEIQDLFGLLAFNPARRYLAGVPDDWAQAKPEDVAAFLQRWREHRFAIFRGAYQALHDLVGGSWYADETTWASIGYPGPIEELS